MGQLSRQKERRSKLAPKLAGRAYSCTIMLENYLKITLIRPSGEYGDREGTWKVDRDWTRGWR